MIYSVAANILFSNPALWIGAFALAVPFIIHLMTRRTPRTIVFPTLRFIRTATANQSRLFRLRHLLMLLVRTILIMLILFAFLKPILNLRLAPTSQNAKAGRAAIILVDTSASMGYSEGGVTPFWHAKVAAREILNHYKAGDRVNLIMMNAAPHSSFDKPSNNVFTLRKDIREAKLTRQRSDIDAALREAIRQFENLSGWSREIHIISDFQRSNWSSVKFDVVGKHVELLFVPVGPKSAGNIAITDVGIQPVFPTVGEPVQLTCKVSNYSEKSLVVPLQLSFNDEQTLEQEVSLAPQMTVSATFRLRIRSSGHYEGQLSIPDDGLVVDNRRYFTLDVADTINVLLVSDDSPVDSAAGSRFVARAINPFLEGGSASAVSSLIKSNELSVLNLSKSQLVILSGVNELSRNSAELLLDYLINGGNIVYFHVGGGDAHNLRLLASASKSEFVLPFKISGQTDLSEQGKYAVLSEANFDHTLLRKFKEAGDLSEMQFYRYFSTERVKLKGQILLRYDDGNIAVAQKSVGLGSILLCNFSCSLEHSDAARHTVFVPLIHEMIKTLRPQISAAHNFEAGRQCFMTVSSVAKEDTIELKDPSEKKINGNVELGQNEAAVFFPQTSLCGFYRAYVNEEIAGSVAVNVNALESNLQTLEVSELKDLTRLEQERFHAASGTLASIDQLMEGKPIWHYFLLAAICFLGLEQILVFVWRR